jgi:hypothetical protein
VNTRSFYIAARLSCLQLSAVRSPLWKTGDLKIQINWTLIICDLLVSLWKAAPAYTRIAVPKYPVTAIGL